MPEAHTKADQPGDAEPCQGPLAEQLKSVRTTRAAPVLGDDRPRPDQEQGRAAAEKRWHEASVDNPQHAEAPKLAVAASAAQVGREGSAKRNDVPTHQIGKQHEAPVPIQITGKQRASRQLKAAAPFAVGDSMSTACDRMPSTKAVSVHQEANAIASSPFQEELPSIQDAVHSPEQEACTNAQQLADGVAECCAADHSQHEMACDQVVQGMSNSTLAGEAMYPFRGEGLDPQQLAGDPHDAPVAEDAPVADDTSLPDDLSIADDAPMADDNQRVDDTPIASNTQTADDTSGTDVVPAANDTVMADVILLADDTSMANETPTAVVTSLADDTPVADVISLAHGNPTADNTQMVGPAAGSSKAAPVSLQAHHEEGNAAPLQADVPEQQAHVQPHQQPNGLANVAQGGDSNQPGQQAGLGPVSTICDSELPLEADSDTGERSQMSMSETPGASAIVPDSEELGGDVGEVAAGQLQGVITHTLLGTAKCNDGDVHVPDSDVQTLPSQQQQHGAVEVLSPTSRGKDADADGHAATSAPGVKGDWHLALS